MTKHKNSYIYISIYIFLHFVGWFVNVAPSSCLSWLCVTEIVGVCVRFLPTLACKVTMCEVQPTLGGSHAGEWGWGAQRTPCGVQIVTWSFSSLLDGPDFCTAISALARLFPLSWETGWASQATRVEKSTTEERIFGEQCFTSGVLPCFPQPLPLPEEGGPVRQWLPAALLPSPPEVLEAKGTSCGWALPRRGGGLRQKQPLGCRLFLAQGDWLGRRAGGGWGVSVSGGERLVRRLRGEEENWTVGRNGEGLFTLPRDGGRWSDRYNVEA